MSVSTALVLKDRIIDAAHKPTVVQWFLSYIGNTNACLGVQVQGVMLTRVVRGWVTCSHSVFHCRPTQQAPAGISSCSHYQTMPIAWSQKFEPGLLVYKHWLFDNVGCLFRTQPLSIVGVETVTTCFRTYCVLSKMESIGSWTCTPKHAFVLPMYERNHWTTVGLWAASMIRSFNTRAVDTLICTSPWQ